MILDDILLTATFIPERLNWLWTAWYDSVLFPPYRMETNA